jgi:uncharacterized membrane protein
MSARTRPKPGDPALRAYVEERAHDFEDRLADAITAFAGSMRFVYIHIIWFAAWIILGVEDYPYGLLTMIVSLESIFLSTFVLISQNRSDEKSQVLADDRWRTVQEQQEQNQELISTASQILELTTDIHASTTRSRQAADT